MSDKQEGAQPRTDEIILGGQKLEATWFHFFVERVGNVRVLALDLQTARKIVNLRFPDLTFAGGPAAKKPSAGDCYLCQVDVVVYGEKANAKDVAEAKRRGDINYEVRTK